MLESKTRTGRKQSEKKKETVLQQGAQKCDLLYSLTFFHADINQSEVEDSFQLASDWIKSVRKNVNKSKAVTLLGFLLLMMWAVWVFCPSGSCGFVPRE